MTHQLVDADGLPVTLPYLVTYVRDDDGTTAYGLVRGVSRDPNPGAFIRVYRTGAIEVVFSRSPDGPWTPPHYGVDPAQFGLRLEPQT